MISMSRALVFLFVKLSKKHQSGITCVFIEADRCCLNCVETKIGASMGMQNY